jgi:UDP-N-acetylmuramyl pentapeptide phosphotransferase/UDP-N-acetylglucosamine-1-phosphate transferase
MPNESLEFSLLSIFTFLSFFTFFIIQKFSHKILGGSLFDKDFDKPQAFHKSDIPRSGGLGCILSFFIFVLLNNLLFSTLHLDYLVLGTGLFLVGFLDDIKFKFSPKTRLALMTVFLLLSVKIFSIQINGIDLIFLNQILSINTLYYFFIVLCFLFIVNGSNLIDGFNGLLAIQLIIINSILLFINIENEFQTISILITAQIIILLIFLLFNFPLAKIFMGDGGAYLFGTFTALNVIETNNLNPNISSFFFCILLFYLFFEVFFSFFRKLSQKKSPIKPDGEHMHMLLYKILNTRKPDNDCNYLNAIYINLIFCLFVLPSILLRDSGTLCKYWFFGLIIIYLFAYFRLNSFVKKKIDI